VRKVSWVAAVVVALAAARAPVDAEGDDRRDLPQLVDEWRSDDAAQRDRASEEVLSRWKEWTDADVEALRRASEDPDAEVAGRARDSVRRVLARRRCGASADEALDLIAQLRTPAGKVRLGFWVNPGGPNFDSSPPMVKLVALGNPIEDLLVDALDDRGSRNEGAVVLGRVGDVDCVSPLIEHLVDKEGALSADEELEYLCVVCALWWLTGQDIGIDSHDSEQYSTDVKDRWRQWHRRVRDFLYTPPGCQGEVDVDMEATLHGVPTTTYRKDHPWVPREAIAEWREGEEYAAKLRDYCLSLLVEATSDRGNPGRAAVLALGHVDDPRAVAALNALLGVVKEKSWQAHDVPWAIGIRADPSSIPFLEKAGMKDEADAIHCIDKHRDRVHDLPLDDFRKAIVAQLLEHPERAGELVEVMEKRDSFQASYVDAAGYVDLPEIRASLAKIIGDAAAGDVLRIRAEVALARLGGDKPIERWKGRLRDDDPEVRLAAAQALWELGDREGFDTLLALLDLRPRDWKSLPVIRKACVLLGAMGDVRALEPLQALRSANLNGALADDQGGAGWPGRADIVALAKLGDDSGIPTLLEAIKGEDRLSVLGRWPWGGDFQEIGEKRYVRDLLPALPGERFEQRIHAASAILYLLEHAK